MALTTADEVYEQVVKALPAAERLRLVEKIAHDLNDPEPPEARPGRSWSEIRGILPCPALGEDAQEWVTRTRRESDESRERQWAGLFGPDS